MTTDPRSRTPAPCAHSQLHTSPHFLCLSRKIQLQSHPLSVNHNRQIIFKMVEISEMQSVFRKQKYLRECFLFNFPGPHMGMGFRFVIQYTHCCRIFTSRQRASGRLTRFVMPPQMIRILFLASSVVLYPLHYSLLLLH